MSNTNAQTHPNHLTDADIQFWKDNGYFCYHHQLLPETKFKALQDYFEELLDDRKEGKRPENMDVPHFQYPKLFDWLLADEVLDFVERFLGPDLILWSSHFICKPPGDGKRVPWHEDSAYWGDRLDPHEVMTVWLAVDDSNVENGCMRVIPGTHGHGFSDYEVVADPDKQVFGREVVADQLDEERAVDLELKAGECHMHHSKTIHGSNPNTSDKRRCGYTMRYMPSNVKFNPDSVLTTHGIYLARGRDLAGNEYAEPGKQHEKGIR